MICILNGAPTIEGGDISDHCYHDHAVSRKTVYRSLTQFQQVKFAYNNNLIDNDEHSLIEDW